MTRLLILVTATAFAQNVQFSLPVLGYYQADDAIEVRPIVGVPGSSRVADPLELPDGITKIHLAPGQPYLLAETAEGLKVVLLGGVSSSIDTRTANPDLVEFAPGGGAAAIYSRAGHRLTVLGGLPSQPSAAWSMELDEPAAFALSANGRSLAAAGRDGIVRIHSKDAAPLVVYQGTKIASLAFHGSSESLAISDSGARRIVSVSDSMARVVDNGEIVLEPGALAASRDGSTAWVLDQSDNSIVRLNLRTGLGERKALDYTVEQFRALAVGDAYLLASPSAETPGWILAGAETRHQTYFIPGISVQ